MGEYFLESILWGAFGEEHFIGENLDLHPNFPIYFTLMITQQNQNPVYCIENWILVPSLV